MKYLILILFTIAFVINGSSTTTIKSLSKYSSNVECDSVELVIPNVFTPNVDGFNDGFNVKSNCLISIDKKIYNRWGELIFQSTQINELWDGRTISGIESPAGTYFYIFTVGILENNQPTNKIYKGSLTLLK